MATHIASNGGELGHGGKGPIEIHSGDLKIFICYQPRLMPNDFTQCIPLGAEHSFAPYTLAILWMIGQLSIGNNDES